MKIYFWPIIELVRKTFGLSPFWVSDPCHRVIFITWVEKVIGAFAKVTVFAFISKCEQKCRPFLFWNILLLPPWMLYFHSVISHFFEFPFFCQPSWLSRILFQDWFLRELFQTFKYYKILLSCCVKLPHWRYAARLDRCRCDTRGLYYEARLTHPGSLSVPWINLMRHSQSW